MWLTGGNTFKFAVAIYVHDAVEKEVTLKVKGDCDRVTDKRLLTVFQYQANGGFPRGDSGEEPNRGFSGGAREPACQCGRCKRCWFDPRVGKIPWRRTRQPTLVFLPRDPMDRGTWNAIVSP